MKLLSTKSTDSWSSCQSSSDWRSDGQERPMEEDPNLDAIIKNKPEKNMMEYVDIKDMTIESHQTIDPVVEANW